MLAILLCVTIDLEYEYSNAINNHKLYLANDVQVNVGLVQFYHIGSYYEGTKFEFLIDYSLPLPIQ